MMTAENKLRFIVRASTREDWARCLALDHTSVSEYVWQVAAQEEQGRVLYSFRNARLPRAMSIPYPRDAEAISLSWQDCAYSVVAADAAQVYGYLTMRLDRAYKTGWIHDLVVDRRWRRHRVGTALLLEARQWAQANGARRLMVETQSKNHPAISFCQRHGMAFCGFNDRYYLNQDIALFFGQNVR
ncbi:MAG: GNAT family N-acetyltransferase [Anaerolineae bacterium]|nr:GNAT family N-acetyltransferase [Anaerolineae bacterium]